MVIRGVERRRARPSWARTLLGSAAGALLVILALLNVDWRSAGVVTVVQFAAWAYTALVVAWVDHDQRRIPYGLTWASVVALGVAWTVQALAAGESHRFLVASASAGAWWAALRLGVAWAGIGRGDPRIGALLGLGLGWMGWYASAMGLITGFLLGGVASAVLLLTRRITRHTHMPLGTFLVAGALPVAVILP